MPRVTAQLETERTELDVAIMIFHRGNPDGVCPNPRLVEITVDYSVGPIPEAMFCDVPLLLSNNCGVWVDFNKEMSFLAILMA